MHSLYTENTTKCFDIDIFFLISEGSCHTEDWNNYAEISALITGIKSIWIAKELF